MDLNDEVQDMGSFDTDGDGNIDTFVGDSDNDQIADTLVRWDAQTGNYMALHENADTNETVALLYDAYGVLLGAEVVDSAGESHILDQDEAAAFVAQSETQSTADERVVSQVPLNRSTMVEVDDVTSSDAYREWEEQSVIQGPSNERSVASMPSADPAETESTTEQPNTQPVETTQPTEAAEPTAIGDRSDANFWFKQNTNYTCGPASATQIIEDFTGVDYPDENVLAQYAANNKWLTEQGMQAPYLAQLLTDFGVPSTLETNQDWNDVAQYLREGRSVVMFVDGYDYWGDPEGKDETENSAKDTVNHFVRIVAIDVERGVAVLSDSGSPNGQQLEVPLDAMEEAWNDVTGTDPATGQPIRGHQLIVSTGADPTGSAADSDVGTAPADTAPADTAPTRGVADLLAPLRAAEPGLMGDILGSSELPDFKPDGFVGALFRNPHGFAVVPLTLAATRIFMASRRK